MTEIEADIAKILFREDWSSHDMVNALVKRIDHEVNMARSDELASVCRGLKAGGYTEAANWLWSQTRKTPPSSKVQKNTAGTEDDGLADGGAGHNS